MIKGNDIEHTVLQKFSARKPSPVQTALGTRVSCRNIDEDHE
jgi:hypothetical protein